MMTHACVRLYLLALGSLCVEVADAPELLADFCAILRLVLATVRELQRAELPRAA
jgi:hypothetical protein